MYQSSSLFTPCPAKHGHVWQCVIAAPHFYHRRNPKASYHPPILASTSSSNRPPPPFLLLVPCGLSFWLNLAQHSGEGEKKKSAHSSFSYTIALLFDQQDPSPFLYLSATLFDNTPRSNKHHSVQFFGIEWMPCKAQAGAWPGRAEESVFVHLFWVKESKAEAEDGKGGGVRNFLQSNFFSIGEIQCSRSLTSRARSNEEKHIYTTPYSFGKGQVNRLSLNRPYASYLGGRLRSLSIEKKYTDTHRENPPRSLPLFRRRQAKKIEIASYEWRNFKQATNADAFITFDV